MASSPGIETCDECVFDGSRWTDQDAMRTLAHAGDLLAFATEGLPEGLEAPRPDDRTWSIVEYVDHLREVVFANHFVAATAVSDPGTELDGGGPKPISASVLDIELADVIGRVANEGRAFASFLSDTNEKAWTNAAVVGGETWDVSWCARHACHDLFHHLTDIARIRTRLGDRVSPMTGIVDSLHAGHGGVPKYSIEEAAIDLGGIVGDRQATRKHHGRPWQALCLYSDDVLDALRSEGHSISAGAAGENITLAGVDWTRLRAGLVIEVGDMRCRLSAPATPCAKNNRWFADGSSRRIDHSLHPGWSRWYATVLAPGVVHPGDRVTVASD